MRISGVLLGLLIVVPLPVAAQCKESVEPSDRISELQAAFRCWKNLLGQTTTALAESRGNASSLASELDRVRNELAKLKEQQRAATSVPEIDTTFVQGFASDAACQNKGVAALSSIGASRILRLAATGVRAMLGEYMITIGCRGLQYGVVVTAAGPTYARAREISEGVAQYIEVNRAN